MIIVPVKTPYMVLHGKQLQLIKLFSLRSLIALKKFRIYNPWELNG